MTSPIQSKCYQCEHFAASFTPGDPLLETKERKGAVVRYYCEAFPDGDGIPPEIINWIEPHTSEREDQEGDFVFSPTIALVEANPTPNELAN